jgi:uncharacterized Zn finger protein
MKTKPEINPALVQITPLANGTVAYWVPSCTQDVCWLVEKHGGQLWCNCPARKPCRHIRAVAARINLDQEAERLASLPRELSGATVSESNKMERIERKPALSELSQAARSARYASAILETTGDFSIYRS